VGGHRTSRFSFDISIISVGLRMPVKLPEEDGHAGRSSVDSLPRSQAVQKPLLVALTLHDRKRAWKLPQVADVL
jgi:hypothetical protein